MNHKSGPNQNKEEVFTLSERYEIFSSNLPFMLLDSKNVSRIFEISLIVYKIWASKNQGLGMF